MRIVSFKSGSLPMRVPPFRQSETNRRLPLHWRVLGFDTALVDLFDNQLTNVQPQARAGGDHVLCFLSPKSLVKQTVTLLWGKPDADVRDLDQQLVRLFLNSRRDLDSGIWVAVFHCIIDKVHENLPEQVSRACHRVLRALVNKLDS